MNNNPLRSTFYLLTAFLCFLGYSLPLFSQNRDFSKEEIQRLINQGQPDSAAKLAALNIDRLQSESKGFKETQTTDLIYYCKVLVESNKPKKALSTLLQVSELPGLTDDQRASVHAELGSLFMNVHSYQLSSENLKKTLKYYQDDYIAVYYWLGQIGRNYIDQNHADSSLIYFRRQLKWAQQRDSLHEIALAKNNIGFAFVQANQPDSGVHYYQEAIEDLLQEDMSNYDLVLYSNLQVNVGKLFYRKGLIKASQIYLEEAYKVARQQSVNEDTKGIILESGFELARAYRELGKFKESQTVIEELKQLPDLSTDEHYELSKLNLQLSISDPSRVVEEKNLKEFIRLSDLQLEKREQSDLSNLELTSEYLISLATTENKLNKSLIEQANAKLKVAEQRKQALLLWVVTLGIIVIMAIGGGFYYVNNKRRQARLRSILLEKDKENLEYELKLKEQDLTNFAITLNMKKEQSQEILDMLEKLKKVDPKNLKSGVDELIRELKNKLNTEKTLDKFEQNFELVNAKFFDKLTEMFPKLTRYEREFCAMIRLNLNNKEIASLKGISLNSAKVSKYRLKKKLELGEDEDIAVFLQKL